MTIVKINIYKWINKYYIYIYIYIYIKIDIDYDKNKNKCLERVRNFSSLINLIYYL